MTDNPLLTMESLPRFKSIKPEHIEPAVTQMLKDCESLLVSLEKKRPTQWQDLMPQIDEINRRMQRIWGPVGHLLGTMNSDALRAAYEKMQPLIVNFSLRYSQSEGLFLAFKSIKNSDQWSALTRAQQRIIDSNIRDAELAGIGLKGENKERFNAIVQELSQLSTAYSNHVLDSTKAYEMILTKAEEIAGIPQSALALAAQSYTQQSGKNATAEKGPWRFTLDFPSFSAFMQHAKRSDLREQIYRAFIARASVSPHDNTPLISKVLQLRLEKANLLGFKTYGDLSMAKKMAGSIASVDRLLSDLLIASKQHAEREFKDLQAFARAHGQQSELKHWDYSFWTERMREHKFQFTDEDTKPYFALPRVLEGLFALVRRLFSIEVVAADGDAEVWHPDVRFFKIYDTNKKHIASFFLDPYTRPATKRGGAWMDDCAGREVIGHKLQVPIAYLVCNSTPPIGDQPSLLTFREVETLFHEFGHGLQHMLTRVDFPQAAGINGVEWDAVELPSQFMENWCYHKPTMMQLARHFQTGAPMPDDLFAKVKAAKNFMAGTAMLRQIRFAATDIHLHHRFNPENDGDLFDVAYEIGVKTSVLPPLKEDRMLCSFSHIFAGGYAAGYYSYKWAEVLSADAFAAFEEAGLDNAEAMSKTGQRFAETVLALGGAEHPMEVFKKFRGREPTAKALLLHTGLH